MKVTAVDGIKPTTTRQLIQEPPVRLQQKREEKEEAEGKNLNSENTQVTEEQVIKAIEQANKAMELIQTRFEFSIHEKTKEIIVRVYNKETGELIREIPPEKILDIVAKIWELAGLIVDERV